MVPIPHTQLIEALNWRYATKVFDPNKKIASEIWSALEQALVLTPSAFGLQPWKFLILSDSPLREKLVAYSWDQRQVAEASHLVVFTVQKRIDEAYIDRFLERLNTVRGVANDALVSHRRILIDTLVSGERTKFIHEWAVRQIFIALGNFVTSAGLLGVDTCPLLIDTAKYDDLLGLHIKGLTTAIAAVAGYRAESDQHSRLAKVRFENSQVIEHVA